MFWFLKAKKKLKHEKKERVWVAFQEKDKKQKRRVGKTKYVRRNTLHEGIKYISILFVSHIRNDK